LSGDRSFAAYALFSVGYIASLEGHYAEGYEQMRVAIAQWRELGDPSAIAMGLNHISLTSIYLGRLDEAQACLEEGLDLLTQVGDRWGMGTAYRHLGLTALAQGDTGLAFAHLRHSLELFQGYVVGWDVARSLSYLGLATLAAGDPDEAARIFLEAFRVAQATQARPIMLEVLVALAQLRLQAGNAEQALGLALLVLDHPAGTHEAKARAGQVCAEASTHLTALQARAARQWADCHPLDTGAGLFVET
jgi:tetratricopeptide (TPR) repeat protein